MTTRPRRGEGGSEMLPSRWSRAAMSPTVAPGAQRASGSRPAGLAGRPRMTASSIIRERITVSLLPRVGMTPEVARAARLQLETVLAGYRLSFPRARDPRVEWAAFPSMIGLYWDLVSADTRGLPPTQSAFGSAVASRLSHLPGEPVRARAHRAYPAFIRQHHFELVLREQFPLVLRGHALDLAGLDFLIIDSGSAYGLALSVDTTLAHE